MVWTVLLVDYAAFECLRGAGAPCKRPCVLRSSSIDFQIMFSARLEGATLSKAYGWYVVEGGRLITQPKTLSGRI